MVETSKCMYVQNEYTPLSVEIDGDAGSFDDAVHVVGIQREGRTHAASQNGRRSNSSTVAGNPIPCPLTGRAQPELADMSTSMS